jgi:predicted nicotinamide N-methyase
LHDVSSCIPPLSWEQRRLTRGRRARQDACDDSTGASIWESSLVLARWLAARLDMVAGRALLELGSGCGTGGLAAAVCARPRAVCLADYAARTFDNLVFNVAANAGAVAGASGAALTTARFDWAAAPSTWPGAGTWDTVIGADLVYTDAMAPLLAGVAAGLLHTRGGAQVLLVVPDGRRGVPALTSALAGHGFVAHSEPAPRAYHECPIRDASEADEYLHFIQLKWTTFRLLTFTHMAGVAPA